MLFHRRGCWGLAWLCVTVVLKQDIHLNMQKHFKVYRRKVKEVLLFNYFLFLKKNEENNY